MKDKYKLDDIKLKKNIKGYGLNEEEEKQNMLIKQIREMNKL